MRQWRVGTISMGILLVMVGVLLLLSRMSVASGVEAILNWWPVVLILLGIEVLVYSIALKEDHSRMKFDGFSIFIIVLILFLSTGAYTLEKLINSGIIERFIN